MTDFCNRAFQVMPNNENKIIRLGCFFKPLKGVLICEATDEEKDDFCCGKYMTYPIVGNGYEVWGDYEDIATGFEYLIVGKKGDTLPLKYLRDAADYNVRHNECDYYDILIDIEDQGITVTNRIATDSEELLPDIITLNIRDYHNGEFKISSAKNNYYVPFRQFHISDIDEMPQLIGDDIWSLMWFFNRKQLRVKIDVPEGCPESIYHLEDKINDYLQKPWKGRLDDHYEYKRPDIFMKS